MDTVHGHLPAVWVLPDFDAHGASNDLVAEANADNADAVLGKYAGGVFDQSLDPGRVVKGVVSLAVKVSICSTRRDLCGSVT